MAICRECLKLAWPRFWAAIKDDARVMKEIEVQTRRDPRLITESEFMREVAWAIYGQNTRADKIYRHWEGATKAFRNWDPKKIVAEAASVRKDAMELGPRVQRIAGKIDAVIEIARREQEAGWEAFHLRLLEGLHLSDHDNIFSGPGLIGFLDRFPYVGATLAAYIAKNIGFDWAKDDRHLKRLATAFGYGSTQADVQRFAHDLSDLTLKRISVVETVLWNVCEAKADIEFVCPVCGRRFRLGDENA